MNCYPQIPPICRLTNSRIQMTTLFPYPPGPEVPEILNKTHLISHRKHSEPWEIQAGLFPSKDMGMSSHHLLEKAGLVVIYYKNLAFILQGAGQPGQEPAEHSGTASSLGRVPPSAHPINCSSGSGPEHSPHRRSNLPDNPETPTRANSGTGKPSLNIRQEQVISKLLAQS